MVVEQALIDSYHDRNVINNLIQNKLLNTMHDSMNLLLINSFGKRIGIKIRPNKYP